MYKHTNRKRIKKHKSRRKHKGGMPSPMRTRRQYLMDSIQLNEEHLASGFTGHKYASEQVLNDFVRNKIHESAQYVHVTVGEQRHAIIVNIDRTLGKIMICDWYGDATLQTNDTNWQEYQNLMRKLQERFQLEIDFYPIDEEIKAEADECAVRNRGHGGCVDYVHRWFDAHSREMHLPV